MTPEDVLAAIKTVEFSRQTHVDWADWLARGNKEGSKYLDDEEFHRRAIREYDHVLAVLNDVLKTGVL